MLYTNKRNVKLFKVYFSAMCRNFLKTAFAIRFFPEQELFLSRTIPLQQENS